MTDPTKARCWDPAWKYVPHEATDIRKTFARIKRQQKEAAEQEAAKSVNVKQLRKAAK